MKESHFSGEAKNRRKKMRVPSDHLNAIWGHVLNWCVLLLRLRCAELFRRNQKEIIIYVALCWMHFSYLGMDFCVSLGEGYSRFWWTERNACASTERTNDNKLRIKLKFIKLFVHCSTRPSVRGTKMSFIALNLRWLRAPDSSCVGVQLFTVQCSPTLYTISSVHIFSFHFFFSFRLSLTPFGTFAKLFVANENRFERKLRTGLRRAKTVRIFIRKCIRSSVRFSSLVLWKKAIVKCARNLHITWNGICVVHAVDTDRAYYTHTFHCCLGLGLGEFII